MTKISQNWDLESIFSGGSDSRALQEQLEKVKTGIESFGDYVRSLAQIDVPDLVALVDKMQEVLGNLGQAGSFIGCLTAQNVHDEKARLLQGNLGQTSAALASVLTEVDRLLVEVPEEKWQQFLADEKIREFAFPLNERRVVAQNKMGAEKEALASDLSVDGYQAWSHLYFTIVSRMSVELERDGKTQTLSVGQAANLLSNPDRNLRQTAYEKLEKAWSDEADLCAGALNHLAGFRLNLYKNRGWDDVLAEPLQLNRMERETLDAMWAAVEQGKGELGQYMQSKAKLLGLEKLAWYDVFAPLGGAVKKIPFEEGARFVVEQQRKFSPGMADFTQSALDRNWVEAEDRGGKRPGAFCTSLPLSKESRVFMTYSQTIQSMGTLAHELGHAYHGYVLKDAPLMLRRYAMNVAETASIFSELLVVDGAIQAAADPQEKLGILADKIDKSVAFFMDLHSRFLFETRFYQARQQGLLAPKELNELMLQAQKDAFCNGLSEYHPHFWASKQHFYLTGVPFYNFPYTFGYLFSAGVYARAKAEGRGFAENYRKLLVDTARMTVEDLAQKHLGVDLTKPAFWEAAVRLTIDDVNEFLQLAKEN